MRLALNCTLTNRSRGPIPTYRIANDEQARGFPARRSPNPTRREANQPMLEPDLAERIRRIFLQPRPHVSIMTATRLLGWTSRQMTAAIGSGAIVLTSTPLGK